MPFGFCGAWWGGVPAEPEPCRGKSRGVTKSPTRKPRRNRRKA